MQIQIDTIIFRFGIWLQSTKTLTSIALDVSKDNLMPVKWWPHIGDIETYWYEIRFAQFYLLVQRTSKKIYKLVGFLLK